MTVNVGEGVGKDESLFTTCVGGNYHNHYGNQFRGSLKIKELLYDSSISLLGIHLDNSISYRSDICRAWCLTALFIIARKWKQLTSPSADEEIMKMWQLPI